jgi:hypothetical protein
MRTARKAKSQAARRCAVCRRQFQINNPGIFRKGSDEVARVMHARWVKENLTNLLLAKL